MKHLPYLCLFLLACGGDDAPRETPDAGASAKYAVASVLFSPQGTTAYISILDSLGPQTIDYGQAVERPGWADLGVHEGKVFVSDGESPTITRYAVGDDGALREEATLSFAALGVSDAAFYNNVFVAADKAYLVHGAAELVVWNPTSMEIEGTIPVPDLGTRGELIQRAGTVDRAAVVHAGKAYLPFYWSDADYVRFAPDSKILVIDVASDEVERVLDAPCSGLDVGGQDGSGTLYFSTWTGGVYGPLVLEEPASCVVTLEPGAEQVATAFRFVDVTDGREGSAVRGFDGERVIFPVFHHERVDFAAPGADPWKLIGELNWKLWTWAPGDAAARPYEGIDWNSGAVYLFDIDGGHKALIPQTDYTATKVFALDTAGGAEELFETRGWAIRLFRVR